MQLRGIGAAVLVSLVGAGFSAQALAPGKTGESGAQAAPVPTGYDAEDHFPGAALYTAMDDAEAAAAGLQPGTTGTTELPDIAVPDVPADDSIRPAAPFALAGSNTDRARALQCLTTAIYYEAAREPDAGQAAVAQVILNRVRHPAFPASVCGVVYQGSEKRGCQFSFACDGSMARAPMRQYWDRAQRVARAALNGQVFAPVGLATHYHTYAVTPGWNRSLVMTGAFGAHLFHRWKGWWGTPAAFSQHYKGGEPLPAPRPRADTVPEKVDPPAPLLAAPAAPAPSATAASRPAPRPTTAPAEIRPAHAESGSILPRYAERADPESNIRDEWKDSGKPLR